MITSKTYLIDTIAASHGLTKAKAAAVVDDVLGGITAALQSGGEVRLIGFGTFSVSERAASTGRNPRTGEKIEIAAKMAVRFKASKSLSDAVNG